MPNSFSNWRVHTGRERWLLSRNGLEGLERGILFVQESRDENPILSEILVA